MSRRERRQGGAYRLAALLVATAVVAVLAVAPAFGGVLVTDSYPEGNWTPYANDSAYGGLGFGQAFTVHAAGTLDSCSFYMGRSGAPTGNMYAYLYAITGIYGTNARPTGGPLATSSGVDVSTLNVWPSPALVTFSFDNSVSLTEGEHYVIAVLFSGGDGANRVRAAKNAVAPGHDGNFSVYNGSTWGGANTSDMCFYVSVSADTDGPVVAASVEEGITYLAPLTVNFSANDAVEGPVAATATLSKDGGPAAAFASGTTLSDAGDYTLVITASDSVPNTTVETINFSVMVPDTEGPVITANVEEGITYLAPLTVNFSATDAVEGPVAATATISKDGGPFAAFASGTTLSDAGNYMLVIMASDSVPITTVEWIYFTVTEPPNPAVAISTVTRDSGVSGDAIRILSGEPITWQYTVTNAGDVPLTNVTVTDSQAGVIPTYVSGDGDGDGALDLTETWVFEAPGTAAAGPNQSSTGSVSATAPGGGVVTASDGTSYDGLDAAIAVSKVTVDGYDSGDGLVIPVGNPITWRYSVSVTGTGYLTGVTVIDDQGPVPTYVGGDDGDGSLQSGETWVYEADGIAIAGPYTNTGTASAPVTDDAGHNRNTTASDTSSYSNPAAAAGTLTGTAIDATTGLPLAGATVDAGAAGSTTSGPDGVYTFAGVAPGDYTVTISKTGYLPQSAVVTVVDGVTTTQDFALTPAPAVVSTPASSAWSIALGALMAGGVVLSRERSRRSA